MLITLIKKFAVRNTHHFLCIKAAENLSEKWREVFLAYFDILLSGAKAPDDKFHYWKNHVFHPPQWGGAPHAARESYDKFVKLLKSKKWKNAIFWAGVLSHYVSDVLHPLHTGQTPDEPKIHKFHEFGTSRKVNEYDRAIKVDEIDSIDNIEEYVRELGNFAHQYYYHVLHNYDPTKAEQYKWELEINKTLDEINVKLLSKAVKAILSLWIRGINEANVTPPKVSLSLRTLITLLKVPIYRIRKWLETRYYKKVTKRMIDELKRTGKIYESLPPDDKGLVDYFRVLEKKGKLDMRKALEAYQRSIRKEAIKPKEKPKVIRTWRILHLEDDIEKAPEIGPKTAIRLRSAGIKTINDLISTPVMEIRNRYPGRKPPKKTIIKWKYETKLMMEILNLWVKDVIWLYEIGIRSRRDLLKMTPDEIIKKINELSQTPHGKSIAKRISPPDANRIRRILEWAKEAADEIPEVNVVI